MIDIIIPVYNTPEEDLERCFKSILRQTFKDYKVYIIDDGSNGLTKSFLDEFVQDKPSFYVKHILNGGVSNARNVGIDLSSSKYLTFLDSDDTLVENFLEEAYGLIQKYDLELVVGGYREIKNGEVYKIRKCIDDFYIYDDNNLDLFMNKLVSGKLMDSNKNIGNLPTGRIYTRIYKRNVLGDLRFDRELGMSEDTLFMIDLMGRVKKIGICSGLWYNYYINDYSISRRRVNDKVINDHMKFIEEIYKKMLLVKEGQIKNAYRFRIFKSLMNLGDLIKNDNTCSLDVLKNILNNPMFLCLNDLDMSIYIDVTDKERKKLDIYKEEKYDEF